MRRRRLLPLVSIAVVACAHAPRGTSSAADVRAAIAQGNARVVAAFRAGDAAVAASVFADDAELLYAGVPPVRGRAAVERLYAGMLAGAHVADVEITTREVEVCDGTAYETGTNAITVAAPGQPPAITRGKYLVVWRRQPDGTWRIHRDVGNSDAPTAP